MRKKSVISLLKIVCILSLFALMVCLAGCIETHVRMVEENSWHSFKHDAYRSAKSEIVLDLPTLGEDWVHSSPQQPKPAWPGPAKWDGYAAINGLANMRNYDPVYHPVVAGKRLYYGSSTDDAVHCIDTETGETVWRFSTQGPVRIAPTYYEGKVYFGSDDGYAYCIDADDGELIWKHNPAGNEQLVINNGRFISFWPVRTGVLVENGIAYFGASMLPWKESFICALDAESGKVDGSRTYSRKYEDLTLEGALLVSSNRLIIPQGRISPIFFNRIDGENLGVLEGGGGCFVLLTDDNHVLHGPGNKTGWITDSEADDGSKFISYENGQAMVVAGDSAFILTKNSLSAYHRSAKKTLWTKDNSNSLSLIMAGDVLFCGGTDKVTAIDALDGKALWESTVSGRAYGLAVADSALFVSTDEGIIYCFRPGILTTPPALAEEKTTLKTMAAESPIQPAPFAIKKKSFMPETGPSIQFISPDSALIRWQTAKPSPTILEYGSALPYKRIEDLIPKTEHSAVVPGLKKNRFYHSVIEVVSGGRKFRTDPFELDNFFNYSATDLKNRKNPFSGDENKGKSDQVADHILTATGVKKGICMLLGFGDGSLAYELAKKSSLQVIGVETDEGKIFEARNKLQQGGVYGNRISVLQVNSLNNLPFPNEFANLIVVDGFFEDSDYEDCTEEIVEMLKPGGGVAYLGGSSDEISRNEISEWLNHIPTFPQTTKETQEDANGLWVKIIRAPIEDGGVWSHQYGLADNSAFGGEALWGASETQDFEVQWMGRPGPRYQADRNGRKPSPLSINGRLFAQGLKRIVALDAHNGTIIWSTEMPGLGRYNIPRDCSNWCADNDYIYTVVKDKCWKIDATTGNISDYFKVIPARHKNWKFDWGYIASSQDNVIGSAVKANTAFDSFYGKVDWYDAVSGSQTFKVCSDNLFALDKKSGQQLWAYSNGVIINSTISIGAGTIYFVESRNGKVKASNERRVGMAELWDNQFLVAVDSKTGKKFWERPLNTEDGITVFYMAFANGKIVIVSSRESSYHVYAFSAEDGKQLWSDDIEWTNDNHGAHMSRPAIVGEKLFVRPAVFNLSSGERLRQEVPKGGCGTYACSRDALFLRASGMVSMWNTNTNQQSNWKRLRPDCWLSTIPAGGLLLSPEGGGGCSCGSWFETSMAFKPKSRSSIKIVPDGKEFIDSSKVKIQKRGDREGIIRYTTDGSEPDENSAIYKKPFVLRGKTTIKAAFFLGDKKPGATDRARENIKRLYPLPQIEAESEFLIDSREVSISKTGKTGKIRYTLDGEEPDENSTLYTTPIVIMSSTKVMARTFWEDVADGKLIASETALKEFKKTVPAEAVNVSVVPGLEFIYVTGKFDKLPDFNSLEIQKKGVSKSFDINVSPVEENFALQFSGFVKVPKDGLYYIFTSSDDGSRLWIGDKLVVDNDGKHGKQEVSGDIALKAGLHPIKVAYFQEGGGLALQVGFKGGGFEKQEIPVDALFRKNEKNIVKK